MKKLFMNCVAGIVAVVLLTTTGAANSTENPGQTSTKFSNCTEQEVSDWMSGNTGSVSEQCFFEIRFAQLDPDGRSVRWVGEGTPNCEELVAGSLTYRCTAWTNYHGKCSGGYDKVSVNLSPPTGGAPYAGWHNCTCYVAYRLGLNGVSTSLFTGLGDAKTWKDRAIAKRSSIRVLQNAPGVRIYPGDVFWSGIGGYGHVAFVEVAKYDDQDNLVGLRLTEDTWRLGKTFDYSYSASQLNNLGNIAFIRFPSDSKFVTRFNDLKDKTATGYQRPDSPGASPYALKEENQSYFSVDLDSSWRPDANYLPPYRQIDNEGSENPPVIQPPTPSVPTSPTIPPANEPAQGATYRPELCETRANYFC